MIALILAGEFPFHACVLEFRSCCSYDRVDTGLYRMCEAGRTGSDPVVSMITLILRETGGMGKLNWSFRSCCAYDRIDP